ncbi:MAG: DUF2268 domain-containing protein [Rhodobacteraceae bacterium]|nr:DUF2268 domain-containing protein [Paracoccaceae bacterium]
MPQMTVHLINARRQLADMEAWLEERLHDAFSASANLLPLRDTDVIVRAGKRVIFEKGHLGYAPEKGVIFVTVDPDNPILLANPSQSLERMLAHELHHSSRWDGPGYGETLGDALVSEGLAGHFTQEVYGGEPEPWEQLPASTWRPYLGKAQADWLSAEYDHTGWFFGSQDFPKWLGYSIGYQVVGQYLAVHGNARASRLVDARSGDFRGCLGAV